MKSLFLTGGFAGFFLCAATGLWAGRPPDLVLRDAALGCLTGALLVQWFWSVLLRGFQETLMARRRAAAQEAPKPAHGRTPPAAPVAAAAANGGPAASRATPLSTSKPTTR
ncbi:MAG: hypothetical protein PHE83_14755 [Opitutaceae bacterium]|nr:hypothetical protein [Opitutaceae bacterium]